MSHISSYKHMGASKPAGLGDIKTSRSSLVLRVRSVIDTVKKSKQSAVDKLYTRSESIQSYGSADSGYDGLSPPVIGMRPFAAKQKKHILSSSTNPIKYHRSASFPVAGAVRCAGTCRCAANTMQHTSHVSRQQIRVAHTPRQHVRAAIHGRFMMQMSMVKAR